VGGKRVHDRVHHLGGQVRRVRELLLGVVRSLLREHFGLQHLALEHAVHVHELVVVGEFALEQVVDLLDDLDQQRLLFVADLAHARVGQRLELGGVLRRQHQRLRPLVLQPVVRQHHLRQVDLLALASELQ